MSIDSSPELVVVDCETTGLGKHDRIVELAAVTVDTSTGVISDEYDTLINPERDVGPTGIHGITPSMVEAAPTFAEIVAALARRLDGAVLVAHNLSFDARMLLREFERLGVPTDLGDGYCTFRATRERLPSACGRYGIELSQHHRALADARATARLAMKLIEQEDWFRLRSVNVGSVPFAPNPRTLRRSAEARMSETARVVAHAAFPHSDEAILQYLDALDWVLDDFEIDDEERAEMARLAESLEISETDRQAAHRSYLTSIIAAAERDGVVTEAEQKLIKSVANALAVEEIVLPEVTEIPEAIGCSPGMRVCFTGQVVIGGQEYPRARLEQLAAQVGMQPVSSVTKKGCDLLVAVDSSSSSGKARKAKSYGIPIMAAASFVPEVTAGGD